MLSAKHSARTYMRISIGAAVLTMGLKFWAYVLTGSVGLFSDAAESSVNLIGSLVGLWMLTVAAQPPDQEHRYGHSKAEYFSSALEGALILVAACGIAFTAIERLINPQPLEQLDVGLGLSLVAALVNAGVAMLLLRAGQRLRSIALRADAHHLLTDVWTSVGVIAGLIAVRLTGWTMVDPIIAILLTLNIAWVAIKLLRESAGGLMDQALPAPDLQCIQEVLDYYRQQGIVFHALRTRMAGSRSFISMHVLVPGDWTVQHGHHLCESIELGIMQRLPGSNVITHLEPVEDLVSWQDQDLDRSP
ncbi:cation diffusion facilitator family transporter [Synechococcales cyanobacterium C]|uniref:Cation diffusion facilitator family transporter n=1 Tax=Petrachloros mirabilis ULC683 TaxID=2781853 RepID=A0A8K2A735_9CYAN|nr:cation diffusion facilitator family transporter [Petrachloros mirabilis]NCJ05615.1 cation diffusion facilitator family transporter [Petrachloros mirabilis ULC683]